MPKKKKILGCSVDGFSFENPLVRDYVAENCRNVHIKRAHSSSDQTHGVFFNQFSSSAVITRKFALLPDTQEKKAVYRKIKNRMVKFRDLENAYINVMCEKVKNGRLAIQTFSGTSTAHVKARIYDPLGFNKVVSSPYKHFELKERVKRCAMMHPYECVRNWIVRNGYLKVLISELMSLFKSDKTTVSTFLGGKRFARTHLKTFFDALKIDVFGNGKFLSYFQISNLIRQVRNVYLSMTALDNSLKRRIALIKTSDELIKPFLEECLNDFTRKKKGKKVKILAGELPFYYLDRYFTKIKNVSTRNAKKSFNKQELKVFKKKRDAQLTMEKMNIREKLSLFSPGTLKNLIKDAFQEELADLETNSSISLVKHVFSPRFSRAKVTTPSIDEFLLFLHSILKNKVKEQMKGLFLISPVINSMLVELAHLKATIHDHTKIPEIKKLTIPIVEDAVYRKDYDNLEFSLGLVKREFFKFRINDKKQRIESLKNNGAIPKMPSVSFKGRKLILNLPFEVKKKADSNHSRPSSQRKRIEIGVDLGLKHFAVLSVMDRTNPVLPREIARYFLGQKALFDLKFNPATGRFQPRDRFNHRGTDHRSNVKYKLIVLRKNIKTLQQKINEYENRLESRNITRYKDKLKFNKLHQSLSLHWERISRINLEIVHLLNHVILQIATYLGASVIKMENLKWVRHSKKKDAGKYLAYWRIQWFFSQVQEAIKLQAFLHSITFKLVNAHNTSKRCSACGKVTFLSRDGEESMPVRKGKSFSCQNTWEHEELTPFRLDSDLNAARNIALAET